MTVRALVFMAIAWAVVLGLTAWSWARLVRSGSSQEHPPPPGTSL